MEPEKVRIIFDRNIYADTVRIAITRRLPDGSHQVGRLSWVPIHEAQQFDPTLVVTPEYIRDGLVKELSNQGFLDESEAVEGLKGKLRATTCHLADMRSLVFEGVKNPGVSTDAVTESIKGNLQ